MEISLALGGGGIRGLAHIGVIKCLLRQGFQINAIAGTSVGGLIGAVYAAGYQPDEILAIIEKLDQSKLYTRQSSDGPSLLGYTGIANTLIELLGDTCFSDLKIPFACTAVDLHTSQEIYLNEGPIVDSLLATIAVPGVLPPKIRENAELIDGSILDPVPVNLARCLLPSSPVVAVALNPSREQWQNLPQFNILPTVSLPIPPPLVEGISRMRIAQAFRIFLQSMDITSRMMTELRLEVDRPEVIIRPDIYRFGIFDIAPPKDLIYEGYIAAQDAIPDIRRSLSWSRKLIRKIDQTVKRKQKSIVTSYGPSGC